MPLNQTLMDELVKRYGPERGEQVYWGMAGGGTGPFGPKGKYRAEHEAIAGKAGGAPTKGKKKAPRPKGRGARGAKAKPTRRR